MAITERDIANFKKKAVVCRKEILEMITEASSGHTGGSLSAVEILISLYFYKMRHKPENPKWPMRDRFIMSKGHASPALYAVLADCGYFPKDELKTFRKLNSRLQGHVYAGVPGVELSTGSLGQGLSVANGIALGAKIQETDFKVYCLIGDGEMQEGQIWEAAMTAPHYKLDNVCVILDRNGLQQNGPVEKIKQQEPIADKWRDFGWNVLEADGHKFDELIPALDKFDYVKDKPTFVIAKTIKGKGVSFMEGQSQWHGRAPTRDELNKALKELGFSG